MFLIRFSNTFSLKAANNIAKIYKIKYISRLNKNNLLILLNRFNAAKMIQRNFREKLILNKECPICNEKLVYPFVSFKIGNKFFYYDFNTIISYFEKSGDFRDPCTRKPIPDKKIYQINSLINYYYGKYSKRILITKEMIKNVEFNIITYCLYDLIKELNTFTINLDNIYETVLPRFIYYINYLIIRYPIDEFKILLNACKQSITDNTLLEYIKYIDNNYC
jgi:hypothetical protein